MIDDRYVFKAVSADQFTKHHMTFLACCYMRELCVLQGHSRPKKFLKDYAFLHGSDDGGVTVAS